MFSHALSCGRQTGLTTIGLLFKEQINHRCKNFVATTAIRMINATSGRTTDEHLKKSGYKSHGPSTVYRDPVRQVLISQSNDVFTNLALEDWLYKYHDFDHKVSINSKFSKPWNLNFGVPYALTKISDC